MMSVLVPAVRIVVLIAISLCASAPADASAAGSGPATEGHAGETLTNPAAAVISQNIPEKRPLPQFAALAPNRIDRGLERTTHLPEPFGIVVTAAAPSAVSSKWAELQSRISSERESLAACDSDDHNCTTAARQFLTIVELGRQRQGRARLGVINRAVNLSIKPTSDWAQYGVEDFWSAPLATLSLGGGDCEDYAIVKYVALRELGLAPDDLRLVIVRDIKRETVHAVLAVRFDEEWLLLDNRMLIMLNALEAPHYYPLFILDHRGTREVGSTAFRR